MQTPIILKRGVTSSRDFYDWCKAAGHGPVAFAYMTIVRYGLESHTVRQRWNLLKVLPIQRDVPAPLDGQGNEESIESLELGYEGIERM